MRRLAALGALLLAALAGSPGCDGPCPGAIQVCKGNSGECVCAPDCDATGRCPTGTQCLGIAKTPDQVCVPPDFYSIHCIDAGGDYTCFGQYCGGDGSCVDLCDHNADCPGTGCCLELSGSVPNRELVVRVCRPPDGVSLCVP